MRLKKKVCFNYQAFNIMVKVSLIISIIVLLWFGTQIPTFESNDQIYDHLYERTWQNLTTFSERQFTIVNVGWAVLAFFPLGLVIFSATKKIDPRRKILIYSLLFPLALSFFG